MAVLCVWLVLAIAGGDGTVWDRGFGYADLESEIPVTSETRLRAASVKALRSLALDTVRATLLECLSDPDPAPRVEALIGLGELGGAATVDALAAAMESDNGAERAAANQALGHQRARKMAAIPAPTPAASRMRRSRSDSFSRVAKNEPKPAPIWVPAA